MKKKSYGNIHSIKDRGIHELSETFSASPVSSPILQRRSLVIPPTLNFSSLMTSEPIMEEESSMKSLRSGSITHGKEMSFQDFADLFMTFSIRLRKDIFNIFKTHSVYSRKIERLQNSCGSSEESETADLEASTKTAQSVAASVTRNTSGDQVDFRARSEKKKIYDAMAVASILNNSAGLDTSKDLVLPADALLHFISHYQVYIEVFLKQVFCILDQALHQPNQPLSNEHERLMRLNLLICDPRPLHDFLEI